MEKEIRLQSKEIGTVIFHLETDNEIKDLSSLSEVLVENKTYSLIQTEFGTIHYHWVAFRYSNGKFFIWGYKLGRGTFESKTFILDKDVNYDNQIKLDVYRI